jgi:outer membrane protein assembly factor BamB
MFHSDLSHTGSSTSNGPTTNQTLWSYTTDSYPVNTSPAIIGGYAYFGSEDDKVYCLNATTGAIVWSYTTGAAIASSPAVADGYVYVGSVDDNVYCLNANTGAYVWSFKTGGYVDTPSATAGDESPPPCSIIPKLNPINRIQRINIAVP